MQKTHGRNGVGRRLLAIIINDASFIDHVIEACGTDAGTVLEGQREGIHDDCEPRASQLGDEAHLSGSLEEDRIGAVLLGQLFRDLHVEVGQPVQFADFGHPCELLCLVSLQGFLRAVVQDNLKEGECDIDGPSQIVLDGRPCFLGLHDTKQGLLLLGHFDLQLDRCFLLSGRCPQVLLQPMASHRRGEHVEIGEDQPVVAKCGFQERRLEGRSSTGHDGERRIGLGAECFELRELVFHCLAEALQAVLALDLSLEESGKGFLSNLVQLLEQIDGVIAGLCAAEDVREADLEHDRDDDLGNVLVVAAIIDRGVRVALDEQRIDAETGDEAADRGPLVRGVVHESEHEEEGKDGSHVADEAQMAVAIHHADDGHHQEGHRVAKDDARQSLRILDERNTMVLGHEQRKQRRHCGAVAHEDGAAEVHGEGEGEEDRHQVHAHVAHLLHGEGRPGIEGGRQLIEGSLPKVDEPVLGVKGCISFLEARHLQGEVSGFLCPIRN
mmetsp:Transcript_167876/g.539220  ORF Transcript_167876/g.539220 Transcript_167876/m.539220 type:complete len:498 (+) Transcript_167876:223-1716(+)